jgi:5-methylcytosine-specific restriction endonuclease McrA
VSPSATAFSHRSILAPLAPERYLLKVTLSRDAHDRLERARALLRHAIPNGDPAAVVERALTALIEQLEKRKIAATSRPRRHPSPASRTRHVPAAVKRAVWARDQGQCAFVGAHGRCEEAAFLEFHHVRPFAVGGRAEAPAGAKAGAQRL